MESNGKKNLIKSNKVQKTELLSASDLLRHAAAIIRFDKEAALNSQKDILDLAAPSNDQSITSIHRSESRLPSSLENLTSHRGSVVITDKANPADHLDKPQNIVPFSNRKKDS